MIIQNSHTPYHTEARKKKKKKPTESCSVLGLHLVSPRGLEWAVYHMVGLVLFLFLFTPHVMPVGLKRAIHDEEKYCN